MKTEYYYPYETKVGRRNFLKSAMIIGASAAVGQTSYAHFPGSSIPGKFLWERLETGIILDDTEGRRKRLEKKFGIRIVNSGQEAHQELDGRRGIEYAPPIDWDSPSLRALESGMNNLPAHFYAPRTNESGETSPLRIFIAGYPLIDIRRNDVHFDSGVSYCSCDSSSTPTIVFKKSELRQTFFDRNWSKESVAHEMTHYVTSAEIKQCTQSIAHKIGIFDERDLHDLFKSQIEFNRITNLTSNNGHYEARENADSSLSKILRSRNSDLIFLNEYYAVAKDLFENFVDYYADDAKKYYEEIQRARSSVGITRQASIDEDRRNGLNFSIRLRRVSVADINFKYKSTIGYGAKNFDEFFSVASSFYIYGKKDFVNNYKKFLGKESAELFYGKMRDEIFLGKEY